MKTATSSNTLKTCAFVVLSSISFASTSQSLELKGEIKCGPGTNGDPGYSQPLSIQFTNGYGVGMTESNDTLENQEVVIASDGTVNFNAIGIWKNQLQRRWRIHGIGTINGTSIQAAGGMYGNSASELVRPKCEISLKSTAPIVAPAANSAGYQVETFGQPLGVSPSSLDSGARFREWGLERGFPWSFRATPTNTPRQIMSRNAHGHEKSLLNEARQVLEQTKAKAFIFIDDGKVVSAMAKPHIKGETLLPSASMSKSMTALAVGKAICEGKLSFNTTASSLIKSLQGTDIGKATLKEILLMSSGSAETANRHTDGITPDEAKKYLWNPSSSVVELVSSSRISTAKPGKATYDYKSTDPYLAALMVQQATGMPFTKWLSEKIFNDAGIADNYALDTDRQGNFLATGGVRLSLNDWIRIAIYVQEQRDQESCFGKYVQDLSKSQIKIAKEPGVNGYFSGYSYFTWTDNDLAPNSAWIAGHFGQRIAFSSKQKNKKIFITFGNGSDPEMNKIYPIANKWIN